MKPSKEEAAPLPSTEEQLIEMPKAGAANVHTIIVHINVELRSLQIVRKPSKIKISGHFIFSITSKLIWE